MVLRASDVADSQLSAELVAERRALLALPVDFPLCEFYTLSDALRTWAVEYGRIESGEISHSEACNVVERAYAGGWHKFRVDWEKARRVGSYARERLQAVGSVDDGEEKRFYHELDVSGLYRECTADAMRGGGLYRARSGSGGGRWRGCGGALRLG